MTGWSFIVILECFECFPLFRVIWHLSIGLTQRSRWCGPKFPICIWSRHMSQWHRGWRLPAVWLVLSLYLSNEIFNYWSFCTISLSACLSACLSFVLAVLVHLSHIFFIPLSEAAYQKSMWNDLVVEVVVVGVCVCAHSCMSLCWGMCFYAYTCIWTADGTMFPGATADIPTRQRSARCDSQLVQSAAVPVSICNGNGLGHAQHASVGK